MADRETNDLYLGDPGFAVDDRETEDHACECDHALLWHVHHPGRAGVCLHGTCKCPGFRAKEQDHAH